MRVVPVTAGMALGDTKIPLSANIFRQVGLGLALSVALAGGSLSAIAMCGLAGEVCAVTAAIVTLRRHGVPVGACGRATAVFVAVMATAVATARWDLVQGSHLLAAAAFLLVVTMLVVLSWWCLPEVRRMGGQAIVLAAGTVESLKQRVARKPGSGSQTLGRKP